MYGAFVYIKRYNENNSMSQVCHINPHSFRLSLNLMSFGCLTCTGHKYLTVHPLLWWLHNSENSTYSMCSLPTCNHILIANDIISPCTLLYLSNKIIPYHTITFLIHKQICYVNVAIICTFDFRRKVILNISKTQNLHLFI